ncbi:Piso0_001955 [Millerozyma farinosa CBS 7064]|uniref:Piso0_001955 protein n=1 Tax=Pichia sorbitophila (strain ATCC MYA-4447 / BCRC 22081 / CBS 7064 / NBRC 10061 / NRRL Y-12695) TaxID=559304 RepID=G8YM54_PICSO|nr:Piso0_001955 [Millerozyma farinosa CBS 7064]
MLASDVESIIRTIRSWTLPFDASSVPSDQVPEYLPAGTLARNQITRESPVPRPDSLCVCSAARTLCELSAQSGLSYTLSGVPLFLDSQSNTLCATRILPRSPVCTQVGL